MGKLETRKARFRYRLRLSGSALEVLTAEWDRCRWVWNECVATALAAYQAGEECGPARLDRKLTGWRAAHEWLRDGSSVAQQQAVRSFGIARAAALKDIKNRVPIGRRRGLPRFKCKSRVRPSLNYTRRGSRLKDDRLLLAGGIALTVVWSRPLPQEPSSVRIYQDGLGHWYASFVIPGSAEPLPATGRAVGIDWGVKVLATASADGHDLSHPAHGKRIEAEVARRRRSMARRRPDAGDGYSKGYLAARHLMAKAYKKAARQRQETARKWAKRLVREFDQIAVEDFRPKFMFKSTMARKASDAAIAATKRELIAMARKHGRDLQLVNPAHTTTDCAQCGARTKTALPLSERTYSCGSCGHRGPRDKNSAMVMLVRAGFNPTGVESTRPDRSPVDQAA